MANADVLYETFEIYLKKAKQCQESQDYASAKKYYINAAEQMLKLAKISKGDVQTVRYQRAKNLVETAKSLDAKISSASPNLTSTPTEIEIKNKKPVSLEDALEKLNSLEGLADVKSHVLAWVDQIKVFELYFSVYRFT